MDMQVFTHRKEGIDQEYEKVKDRARSMVKVNGWDLESVRLRLICCNDQEQKLIEDLQSELIETALTRKALYEIRDEVINSKKKVY